MLPGITGMLSGLLADLPAGTIFVEDEQTDSANQSSYTFSIDGHKAQDNRRIFIPVHYIEGSSHRTISSVTINGVSASIRQRGHNGGSTGLGAGIAHASVPSGDGTITVQVSFSGGVELCVIAAVVTYGFASSATDFGTDQTDAPADDVAVNVDVPAGGFVIAVYTGSTNAEDQPVTWTGATEQYDFDTGDSGNAGRASMAFQSGLSMETNREIRAAIDTEGNDGNDLVVESWGLA